MKLSKRVAVRNAVQERKFKNRIGIMVRVVEDCLMAGSLIAIYCILGVGA